MEGFKKYDVALVKQRGPYADYIIKDLKKVYIGTSKSDKSYLFNGACGVIKNPLHPGYCSLCAEHREDRSSFQFGDETGVTYEYAPLYNEDGQRILIKFDRDEMCATVMETRRLDIETGKEVYEDYRLGTFVYGTGNMWDKVE